MLDETGSDVAAELWNACDAALSSRLAYPEVCAAPATATNFVRSDPLTARSRAGDRLRTPTIVLTGAVVDVDGTNVTLDDIAISNNEFGCFAG